MVELRKYITRKNAHGDTEWHPPAHLDHRRPKTNCMHHPEKPLKPDGGEAALAALPALQARLRRKTGTSTSDAGTSGAGIGA